MKKEHIVLLYTLLALICFYCFFHAIGAYPLLDIDETRYVHMAREMFNTKDYLTLYLNGDFFFEKPPLYFWIECISFKLTGVVSELTARLPIVLLSLLPAGFLIYLCRKVKDDKFAIISTATLFTSLEYIILTKIAILDSVLTSFVTASVFSYFATYFAEEKNKKYFWMLVYIFSGLAVLAKGIPGVAIPAIVIAISSVIFKTYKDSIKYSWGVLLFLAISLPWHIVMLKLHGRLFFDEYIIRHHFLRFVGSNIIGRSQPWYFFILMLLWGLFPHIFILISQIFNIKNIQLKQNDKYSVFLYLNSIAALVTLIFFSMSDAKLITYILPIYPFCAVIIGAIWYKYIYFEDKPSNISVIVFNVFLTLVSAVLLFAKFLMPFEIYLNFQNVQIASLLIFIPWTFFSWLFWIKRERLLIFFSAAFCMSFLSGFLTPSIYEFIYTFGQDDLMRFAQEAKANHCTISAYLIRTPYSLLYYGNQSRVDFHNKENVVWLRKELDKKNNILIMKNKDIKNLPLKIVEKGEKYSIVERIDDEK